MKKVIFTCGSLTIGGVQKSLINLLKNINYNQLEVHLMLSTLSGELLNQVPKNVKIIEAPQIITYPSFSKRKLHKDFLFILTNPTMIGSYIKAGISAIKYSSKHAREIFWNGVRSKVIFQNKVIDDEYDIAVSFAGGIGIWNQVIIDKINARKKICWIHGDYSVFGTGTSQAKNYINKFDKVVTVSEKAEQILLNEVPQLLGKTTVIYNIIDRTNILELAKKETVYNNSFNGIRFISISRLDKGKGFDVAIKAFSRVVEDGLNVKWDIIGDGPEMITLSLLVKKLNLENRVRLLGKKMNPYPYLKEADVFFHPSKGEGKSISVDEAKIMQKPILITAYPTVRDQIEDDNTGRVVNISETGLYNGIVELIKNDSLRRKLSCNLSGFNPDKQSIEKIESILY
nr:glycosyltransferase [Paenibacillus bovis]